MAIVLRGSFFRYTGQMILNYKGMEDNASAFIRVLRIVLLVMTVAGIALIVTRDSWVPKVVNLILSYEEQGVLIKAEIPNGNVKDEDKIPTPMPIPSPRPGKVDTGVEGIVTIGPTCPVVRYPADPKCADKPYETTLVIASTLPGKGGGILVKTGKDGYFSQELVPGTYTIRTQQELMLPSLAPETFTVKQGQRAALNLVFDSGIR